MPAIGFKKLIAGALPGCMQELETKSGCAQSTIRRWLHRMRKTGECCISGWMRNSGAITAIYSGGMGPDAPCRLKKMTPAEYSKGWRKRAKKSGDLAVVYALKNARDRARTAARQAARTPNTWFGALPGAREVSHGC